MRTWTAPDGTAITYGPGTFGTSLKSASIVNRMPEQVAEYGDIFYSVAALSARLVSAVGPLGPLPVDLVARTTWLLGLPDSCSARLLQMFGDDTLTPEEERSTSVTPAQACSGGTSTAAPAPRPTSAAPVGAKPRRRGRGK